MQFHATLSRPRIKPVYCIRTLRSKTYSEQPCGFQVSSDTACSSALVAIHQARAYLQTRPGASALACAVNLMLAETTTAAAQAAGMLTLDGRCKTLDASADGYVR